MSAWEDDAGLMGDALADLVEAGAITDKDALGYLAGDHGARRKVADALSNEERKEPV